MTISEIYGQLCSRNFYEKNGSKRFRFRNNTLMIDRKALLRFLLYEEKGYFFITLTSSILLERDLRIEWEHDDGCAFHFYGKGTGLEMLVLE